MNQTLPSEREKEREINTVHVPVSYTHLDVYKRQALIFVYLGPEQTILGLIREDDDDKEETQYWSGTEGD